MKAKVHDLAASPNGEPNEGKLSNAKVDYRLSGRGFYRWINAIDLRAVPGRQGKIRQVHEGRGQAREMPRCEGPLRQVWDQGS